MAHHALTLIDTDVLSAMSKIGRLEAILRLLRDREPSVTPGVVRELAHSLEQG